MKQIAFALFMLVFAGAVFAQQQVTPIVPFSTPAPLVIVTPDANDARVGVCNASRLPHFVPYVVRAGDRLADLIVNSNVITVTQLAAINCIDDPDALPVGATIWLPEPPSVSTESPASTAEATQAAPVAAIPAMTPEATVAPVGQVATTPAATAQPGSASINDFTASKTNPLNTEALTLRWSASGSAAYLYLCMIQNCVRPQNAQALPTSGSITYSGFQSAGTYRYRLDVQGVGGAVTQDLSVTVTCAQQWLGGIGARPECPQDPARTVFGVWQPFERGVMIWFSDTQQIYVMKNDGTLMVYVDHYVDGQANPSEKAPNGRFTPVRGFGLLWQELGGANNPLGWATAQEIGYDAARQAAGQVSYMTYIQGPASTVYAVTLLPGSQTGYWAQVAW